MSDVDHEGPENREVRGQPHETALGGDLDDVVVEVGNPLRSAVSAVFGVGGLNHSRADAQYRVVPHHGDTGADHPQSHLTK